MGNKRLSQVRCAFLKVLQNHEWSTQEVKPPGSGGYHVLKWLYRYMIQTIFYTLHCLQGQIEADREK